MEIRGRIWTIPNVLSFFRLILLVPIVWLLLEEQRLAAFALMVIGAVSDTLDGYIARRWNQCSDLGRMMDPLIDKVNVIAVTAVLVFHPAYAFPLWVFVFLLTRELAVLVFGLAVIRRKNVVMESERAGKNSALAVALAVVLFVFDLQPYGWILLVIGLALTAYSSFVYLRRFLNRDKVNDDVS